MRRMGRTMALGTLLVALLVAAGNPVSTLAQDAAAKLSDNEARQAAIGLKLAPVPLNFAGRNRQLVGLGSYLVNLATCSGCHTTPEYASGGNPFQGEKPQVNTAGYLTGGASFGAVTSANITPDKKGRPAGLTYDQFVTAMTTGKDHDDPDRLLQTMPWPAYKYLTTRQLRAIYAYLSAIPSLPPKATE
jgi:hypothetical protein